MDKDPKTSDLDESESEEDGKKVSAAIEAARENVRKKMNITNSFEGAKVGSYACGDVDCAIPLGTCRKCGDDVFESNKRKHRKVKQYMECRTCDSKTEMLRREKLWPLA